MGVTPQTEFAIFVTNTMLSIQLSQWKCSAMDQTLTWAEDTVPLVNAHNGVVMPSCNVVM